MLRILIKSKCLEESIADLNVVLWIHVFWDENKNACNEIRNTNSNDNEPKNVVHVENLVLLDNSFIITLFTLHFLEKNFESADVDQLNQPWHSAKSKQFGERSWVQEFVKRKHWDKIDGKPSLKVTLHYHFMVLNFLLSVWVKICRKEVKDDVGIKVVFNKFIPEDVIKISWCWECYVVHRGETTVSHKEENPNVKKGLPLAVSTDYEVFSEAFLSAPGLHNLHLLFIFDRRFWRLLTIAVLIHHFLVMMMVLTNFSLIMWKFKSAPLPEQKPHFLFSPHTSRVFHILHYYFGNFILFCWWLLLLVWYIL